MSASALKNVFVVAAKRTPFGAFGGSLKDFTATKLQELSFNAALKSIRLAPERIDSVISGNVIQEIMLGESSIVLCGGTESMTQAPFVVRDVRFGTKLGFDYKFEDSLWEGLTDQNVGLPMGITAERLAEQYQITKEDCDRFAVRSHSMWKKALDAGLYSSEMFAVPVKGRKGVQSFEKDEHARPELDIGQMAKLKPVFKKDGTVTAASASGVCDGAASLVLASEKAVKEHSLEPLARLVDWGVVGCDPKIMGIGPAPAIRLLLKRANCALDDVDLVEVNEAFAAQTLAVQRELKLDDEKLNTAGGAIAVGHPLGASGARISAHLVHQIQDSEAGQQIARFLISNGRAQKAIGSACIGGGQGIALLFEKC